MLLSSLGFSDILLLRCDEGKILLTVSRLLPFWIFQASPLMLLPWILVFLVAILILEWFLANLTVSYFSYYITKHDDPETPWRWGITDTWLDCLIILFSFFLPPLLLVPPLRLFVFMYRNQHPPLPSPHHTTTTTTGTRCTGNTESRNSTNPSPPTSPTIHTNPTYMTDGHPTNLGLFPRLSSVIQDTFHITSNEGERNNESERNDESERTTEADRRPGFAVRRLSLFDLTSLDNSETRGASEGAREEEEPPPTYSEAEGLDCPPPAYSQVEGGRLRLGRFIMVRDNNHIKAFRV